MFVSFGSRDLHVIRENCVISK
jgi:hypothetical protein